MSGHSIDNARESKSSPASTANRNQRELNSEQDKDPSQWNLESPPGRYSASSKGNDQDDVAESVTNSRKGWVCILCRGLRTVPPTGYTITLTFYGIGMGSILLTSLGLKAQFRLPWRRSAPGKTEQGQSPSPELQQRRLEKHWQRKKSRLNVKVQELEQENSRFKKEVEELERGKLHLEKQAEDWKREMLWLEEKVEKLERENSHFKKEVEQGKLCSEKQVEDRNWERSQLEEKVEELERGKLCFKKEVEELEREKMHWKNGGTGTRKVVF
ncbi:hypothetical protein BDZ91DRAFT_95815 [Kalaharituber pfeilii]|nr:hypothetical protein BDZ91DRAFT_95815 [Kalaharituber pfeilii]